MHVIRFANSLGTPNWFEPGLANCLLPRITGSRLTYGGFVNADYNGPATPKTILFWGHNPVVTGPDGELAFPVKEALRKGSFGICVDPRKSETAKRCGMWLPIRPGTDAALALAMIHVILEDNLHDADFVSRWTVGSERLRVHVKSNTPEWAQAVTGIPASDIADAARRYAIDKPSVIEWGVAIEQTPNSLQTVRAIAILRGLTGNIDCPGGDILGMNILQPYPVLRECLSKEAAAKRVGAAEFKLLGGFRSAIPSAHVPGVFRAVLTGDPYPVRAMMIFGSNPLITVANPRLVYRALMSLDTLAVADLFMTPTATLADYVLPAAFWPEVNQIMELPYVSENAVLAQQRVLQFGQCRQDEEIMIDLARRLELPGNEDSLEDILNHRLEPLGIRFDELKQKGIVHPPHRYYKYREKGFRTPSGKVELYCRALERMGYEPLPVYREPPESPVSRPDLVERFPLVLTTGARRAEYFHSELRQIGSLRKRRPYPVAEIHPDTALPGNIGDGDWIRVTTARGTIRMRAVVTEGIRKDVVNIDHGWWFPEKKDSDLGVWESNANLLTSDAPPYDAAFGSCQLRSLLCHVEKIDGN
jgi:anaerobic selenocysteine-containing dehydrogenase